MINIDYQQCFWLYICYSSRYGPKTKKPYHSFKSPQLALGLLMLVLIQLALVFFSFKNNFGL